MSFDDFMAGRLTLAEGGEALVADIRDRFWREEALEVLAASGVSEPSESLLRRTIESLRLLEGVE